MIGGSFFLSGTNLFYVWENQLKESSERIVSLSSGEKEK